jgi:hypothetical protein
VRDLESLTAFEMFLVPIAADGCFPTDWHREHGIPCVGANLIAIKDGARQGGFLLISVATPAYATANAGPSRPATTAGRGIG